MLFRPLFDVIKKDLIMIENEYLIYQMGYDGLLYFSYDSKENVFYDPCGIRVINIFEIITPNDLFLFRQNPRYCLFPYIENKFILCVIITDE